MSSSYIVPSYMDALFPETIQRRLSKARHQEMNHMEIRTKTLCAMLLPDRMSFTIYKLQIHNVMRRRKEDTTWILEKRYSEFYRFRKQMLKKIQQWEISLNLLEENCKCAKRFDLLSNCLRRPMSPDFPRKHLRTDTVTIIMERRTGLPVFIRQLLQVYTDLSLYFFNGCCCQDKKAFKLLEEMYSDLEMFLEIPEQHKEMERKQLAAILSLQDVKNFQDECSTTNNTTPSKFQCCICLEEEDAYSFVQLPCSHQFHEDCVLDWFNASTTCPLCRQNAINDDALEFDVSVSLSFSD